MYLYSLKIPNLFSRLGLNMRKHSAMVPKSDSAGVPGDLVFFRYRSEPTSRLAMLVRPIAKDAATGNLLMTCLVLDPDEYTELDQLKTLYTDRSDLGDDVYRTFIMSFISGPLYRMNLPDGV